MKKPKIDEFKLKSIKLHNGGGAVVKYGFQYPMGNEAHTDTVEYSRSLNIHDELFQLLNKQKPNVLIAEGVKYRDMPQLLEQMGGNEQEKVSQLAEGFQQDAMQNIAITGVSVSGSGGKKGCVITFNKITVNKKVAGRSTTLIQLSGNSLGFEQDLEEDLEQIRIETYNYLYKDLHSDSAQGELPLHEEEETVEETE